MTDVAVSEKQFERQVKDAAKLFGWLYYHTHRSQFSPAGFPDCVMVRGDRLIFAELKSAKGKVSEEQYQWLDALAATAETFVWRPDDIEEIIECLK